VEKMVEYINIKLPKNLAESIDEEIEQNPKWGFRSRAEYIIALVRREIGWNRASRRSRAEFKEKFGIDFDDIDAIRKLPKAKKREIVEFWNQPRPLDYLA
jgi:Arc/MetJ-type ribon-helix-helix transcriptional regulator